MRQLFHPLVGLSHPLSYKHPQSLADRLHGKRTRGKAAGLFRGGGRFKPASCFVTGPPH